MNQLKSQSTAQSPSAPLLTVLVPIYNASPYLRQALDSLAHQTLRDLEILCINDGSTDDSLAIIKSYQASDPRFCLLDKPNTGYGDSMNQGIKLARGRYLGILEPDDWLELDAFSRLTQLAEWHRAEVVKANYFKEFATASSTASKTTSTTAPAPKPSKTLKTSEIRPRDTGKLIDPRHDRRVFTFAPAIWSAIYRRDFLLAHHLEFLPTPGASYQDLGFSFKVWATARRVVLTDAAYYHYRLDNSNSSVHSPGKLNCVVEEYAAIADFLADRDLTTTFSHTAAAAKFRNYHWNLQRLSPDLAQQFYRTMVSELRAASAAGELRRADFSPAHWAALQLILRNPDLAYRLLRLRSRLKSPA